ncbi:MAG: ATP-binding protein [Solirubrobacteraceae bacterium]
MLRVRLVGELGLEADGRRCEPPAPTKARALLAWLALHPGPRPRSELAGTFWPDVLEESARASLRTALSAVRRSLGDAADDHLEATREAVGLRGAWVDALAFEQEAATGRLEDALALADGELLPGLDDEWARDARDRHRQRRGELLGELAARVTDPAEAVRHARARVALDPLSEEAARDLIRHLAAAGDRAGALVAYDELRERLRTTLGIPPSAPTRELVASIRSAARERPPSSPLLDRRTAGVFVGREAELARAGRAPGLVVLEGEAGVGKTRLALELARAVRDRGGVALVGRCSEEPLRPYEAWAEALRPIVEEGELERMYAEGERFLLFEAVRRLLAEVAEAWPVVVVLDDLHWADRPTLLLLAHLVRAPEGAPARLVGTYRSTELHRDHPLAALLADARREHLAERVSLRGLEAEATAELVAASTGSQTPERVTRAVHAETAGNPFFVVEIARHLAESGLEFGEKGRWTGAFSLADVGLPESVREVLGRRLDRIGDPAHAVLREAALLGERFELDALPDPDAALDALDAALAAGLVREEPGAPGRYAFAHALVRQTLYEELSAARRVRAHAAAAERLLALREGGRPVAVAEIAHHLIEAAPAGDPLRAAEEAERAAAEANAALAWEDAAAHAARALQALEWLDEPPGELRARLLLTQGEAQMRAGDRAPARAALREAMALYGELGRPEELARAALALGGVGIFIGHPDEEVTTALGTALAALPPGAHATRARVLGRLAVEQYYEPPGDARRHLSEAALRAARRAGDDATLAAALNARHVALWDPDHVAERLSVAEEMIAVAERVGDSEAALQGRNWRVVDLFELGDLDGWWEQVEDHARVAEGLRLPSYRWYTPLWHGVRSLLEGRYSDAARAREQARTLGTAAGDGNAELFASMLEHGEHVFRGDYAAADWSFMEEAMRTSPAAIAYRPSYAWMLAAVGRLDEGQSELDALAPDRFAAIPFDANWMSAMAELTEACLLLEDRATAAVLHELLTPYAGMTTAAGRAVAQYGFVDEFLGRLGLLLGRAEARGQIEGALGRYERHGWRPFAERARATLARSSGVVG